ncbi:hypothetical protein M8J77_022610 [Diaphorina citri]|nr:hypothetical protein M8J77_022610 [Diaphorina citri]
MAQISDRIQASGNVLGPRSLLEPSGKSTVLNTTPVFGYNNNIFKRQKLETAEQVELRWELHLNFLRPATHSQVDLNLTGLPDSK